MLTPQAQQACLQSKHFWMIGVLASQRLKLLFGLIGPPHMQQLTGRFKLL